MIAAETETEKYQQPRRQSPHLGGAPPKLALKNTFPTVTHGI